jgi:hypothetical protein
LESLFSLMFLCLFVHLGQHLLGHLDRMVGARHAGIDRHVQQRTSMMSSRVAPGVGRRARVQRQFLVIAKRRQQRERHHRALALRQIVSRDQTCPRPPP